MEANQQSVDDAPLRRFEYEDELVFAADLGVEGEVTVDVVDGTVVVATPHDQYDLELPADEPQAFIRNGVLTVEVMTEQEEDSA